MIRTSLQLSLVFLILTTLGPVPSLGQRDESEASRVIEELGVDDEPAAAADSEGEAPARGDVWYERIVVSATRTDRSAADVPLHATVMGLEEIARAPEYGVMDMLRRMPSINIQADNSILVSTPNDGGIAFRGLGGTARGRALVLIDGIPVNEPFGTNVIWTRVPRDAIERIEVLPGGTGIWGNLSLSGVVNMITNAPESNRLSGGLRLGDHSTWEGLVSYSDVGDNWSGWISANYLDSDGYHLSAAEDRGSVDQTLAKHFGTLTGKLSRSFSDRALLRLGATIFDEEMIDWTPLQKRNHSEESVTVNLDLLNDDNSRWELRFYGRGTQTGEVESDVSSDRTEEELDSETQVPTKAFGLSGVWFSKGAGKHAISAGADLQTVAIDADVTTGYDSGIYTVQASIEGEQNFAGLFLQDVFTLSERTSLNLGGRFDVIRTQDGFRRQIDVSTGEITDRVLVDRTTEETFNPSLGIVHAVSARLRVRGSLYSGFRAGAPAELFVDNLGTTVNLSNPNLKPERLVGIEAGLDFTPSHRSSTRLTIFQTETEDLIDRLTTGRAGPGGEVIEPCGFVAERGRCRVRANLDTVRTGGIEVDQDLRFGDFWRFHLAGTLMDTEVTDSPANADLEGNRVGRVPNEMGVLSLSYTNPRRFDTELRARYVGNRWDNAGNTQYLPSQFVVDLSFGKTLNPRWRVYAGVTNVFDRRVRVNFASAGEELAPPRLAQAGFRFASR